MKTKSMSKSQDMLDHGSFLEILVKLSLPAVVIILVMIVYNLADTYFIGQTGDPNKISAISLSMPVFTILSGLGTLFGNGGGTSISIALGEGNYDKIKRITAFCMFGNLVLGLLAFAAVFFAAKPLALLLGADKATLSLTCDYLRIFSFCGPLVLFSTTFAAIIRSDGDAPTAMIANFVGTIVNILLDALFILVFGWDVKGAAFATVLGNLCSCLVLFFVLTRKKREFLPNPRELTFSPEIIIPTLTLGLPMTCSTLLSSISGTIQNRLMISHGSIALAAQGVAGKVGMIITMLIMGFCMGMQPAISYNYGNKNYKRMYRIVRQTGLFTVVLGILLTVVCTLAKGAIVSAFIDNEQVIAYGNVFVLASVIVGPVYGIYQLCQTFLQATGKADYAIFVSLLDKGIIFIPVLFFMNRLWGAYGIAFSHAVTMVFSILAAVFLILRWKKKLGSR